MLAGAWAVVALALLVVQLKIMAHGPKSVTSQQLTNLVNRQGALVLDIRGQGEFNKGHIHGAKNIPMSQLADNIDKLSEYKDKPIVVVCANGISVSAACSLLAKKGFNQVYKLQGGMAAWNGDNLPVVKA